MSGGSMMENAASSMLRRTARQHERPRRLTTFFPIAVVLGLLAGGLGATLDALPAAALPTGQVSGVTFSGSSMVAGATPTTWTVGFTTSVALTGTDSIYVVFDSWPGIPATPVVTLPSGFVGCTATAATIGSEVVITLVGGGCALAASTPATLTIAGITNPGAGSYANTSFLVATSNNAAAA